MTLKEYADRMWKEQHGDKTYEQVEAEYNQARIQAHLDSTAPMQYVPSEECQRMERLRAESRRRTLAHAVGHYTSVMLVCYAIVALAVALWYD